MKLEITKKLYSKDFRWIECNFWKKTEIHTFLKLHIKIPLTLHTWKICWKSFPGSVWVMWED